MQNQLIIITGVSGSGKSTALKTLEDAGFFCVDNLPAPLISQFVDFLINLPPTWSRAPRNTPPGLQAPEPEKWRFALLIDCREELSFPSVAAAGERLGQIGAAVSILYLDCQDEVVIRRFRETRRPHPLLITEPALATIAEALARERELLAEFRGHAERIFDTTAYSPHELRRAVESFLSYESTLEVTVLSFGFKYGVPYDVDLIVDVRFLPNPHFVAKMQELTGNDAAVRDYVFQTDDAEEFLRRYLAFVEFLLPRYQGEGKRYLTIGVGCTGGRHRSVAIAVRMQERLIALGVKAMVRHRDINRLGSN